MKSEMTLLGIMLPLIGLALIILTGCASNSTPEGQAQNAATYGQASQVTSYGISCWVLSLSKGDAVDLAEKKVIFADVVKYLKLAKEQGFNGAQIASGFIGQVPAKAHWQTYVKTIQDVLRYASGNEAKAIVGGLINGIENAVAAF